MNIETLAKELHEAGREAVEKKAVVNPGKTNKFLEWDGLKENMKEGRRIQARFLLNGFAIVPKDYMLHFDILIRDELKRLKKKRDEPYVEGVKKGLTVSIDYFEQLLKYLKE